jgi:hypothetical protein
LAGRLRAFDPLADTVAVSKDGNYDDRDEYDNQQRQSHRQRTAGRVNRPYRRRGTLTSRSLRLLRFRIGLDDLSLRRSDGGNRRKLDSRPLFYFVLLTAIFDVNLGRPRRGSVAAPDGRGRLGHKLARLRVIAFYLNRFPWGLRPPGEFVRDGFEQSRERVL